MNYISGMLQESIPTLYSEWLRLPGVASAVTTPKASQSRSTHRTNLSPGEYRGQARCIQAGFTSKQV